AEREPRAGRRVLTVAERPERVGEAVAGLVPDHAGELDVERARALAGPALAARDDDRLARAAREIDDRRAAAGRDLAAGQPPAVAHQHAVLAGRDREPDRLAARLVGLGDHRVRALVLD